MKASQSKQVASARHDDQDPRSHLYQLTVASQENHPSLVYSTIRLLGDSQPFVGYTPEQVFGRTTHNGIGPLGVRFTESGSHRVTITWTFPDGEQPSLVAIQPLSNLPGGDIGLSFPVATEELVMDMDLQVTLGNPGTIAGVISVNGRPLLDLATGSYANTGPQDASLMLMPLLQHPVSGAYRLTMVVDGEVEIDETYIQRRLVWDQPWPTIETSSFEPVSFQNHLSWDFGPPSVDANVPGWRAAFPAGVYFPPEGPNQSRPYQAGSTASFTWDPEALQFSARTLEPGAKFRLEPAREGLEYESREDYLRAREAQTTFTYSVEGRAASYPSGGLVPVYIKALGGGQVPAKKRQLSIQNARFEPDPTEPGAGSTFRADVVSFFFDEPQISWQFILTGPDPEDPQTDGTTYLESYGDWQDFSDNFDLSIPWNGFTEDGLQGPPGTYRASLIAHVREKTKVNAQGGPILLSELDESARLVVAGAGEGPLVLEVLDANSDRVLASTAETSQESLGRIFLDTSLKIRVRGVRFTSAPPESLTVTLDSLISRGTEQVPLRKGDRSYEGVFTLTPEFIRADFAVDGQAVQTTFTSVFGPGLIKEEETERDVDALLRAPFYRAPRARLGSISSTAPQDSDLVAPPSPDNVRSAGFETVRFTLSKDENPLAQLPGALSVALKVKHPATVLFINSHGIARDRSTGTLGYLELGGNDGYEPELDLAPSELRPGDLDSVRTLLCLGCNVLDLHDYNNARTMDHEASAGINERPSPGMAWWSATRPGNTVLLGYNAISSSEPSLIPRYIYLLENLLARDASIRPQHAWLRANWDLFSADPFFNSWLLGACSWDNGNYYYIPATYVDRGDASSAGPLRPDGPVFLRIPSTMWSTDLEDWKIGPPPDVAQQFDIPQLP